MLAKVLAMVNVTTMLLSWLLVLSMLKLQKYFILPQTSSVSVQKVVVQYSNLHSPLKWQFQNKQLLYLLHNMKIKQYYMYNLRQPKKNMSKLLNVERQQNSSHFPFTALAVPRHSDNKLYSLHVCINRQGWQVIYSLNKCFSKYCMNILQKQ